VWRGALARQAVKCLAVDDERGLVQAPFECLGCEARVTLRLTDVTAP
jgi:hypothetical protein